MNNNQANNLVFDNIAASVLNEENSWKSKKDKQVSSQQAKALSMMRERSTKRSHSGSHNNVILKSKSKKNVKC